MTEEQQKQIPELKGVEGVEAVDGVEAVGTALAELRHASWPLGIYPPALKALLRQACSPRQALGLFALTFLYLFVTVCLCRALNPYCFQLAVATTILVYFNVMRLQHKSSWSVKHLPAESASMRIAHESERGNMFFSHKTANQLVVTLPNKVVVVCSPLSMDTAELYVDYGSNDLEVRLWSDPNSGLPTAVEYAGNVILLRSEKPKGWKKRPLLADQSSNRSQ